MLIYGQDQNITLQNLWLVKSDVVNLLMSFFFHLGSRSKRWGVSSIVEQMKAVAAVSILYKTSFNNRLRPCFEFSYWLSVYCIYTILYCILNETKSFISAFFKLLHTLMTQSSTVVSKIDHRERKLLHRNHHLLTILVHNWNMNFLLVFTIEHRVNELHGLVISIFFIFKK